MIKRILKIYHGYSLYTYDTYLIIYSYMYYFDISSSNKTKALNMPPTQSSLECLTISSERQKLSLW